MKYYYAARIETDGGATEIDGAQVVLSEEYDRLRKALKMLMEDVGREFKPWEHVHCEWSWHKANQALQGDRDDT